MLLIIQPTARVTRTGTQNQLTRAMPAVVKTLQLHAYIKLRECIPFVIGPGACVRITVSSRQTAMTAASAIAPLPTVHVAVLIEHDSLTTAMTAIQY